MNLSRRTMRRRTRWRLALVRSIARIVWRFLFICGAVSGWIDSPPLAGIFLSSGCAVALLDVWLARFTTPPHYVRR
jgi:hypothetical protein